MNTIWNNNSQHEEPEMQFGLKKIKAIINMVLWLGWDIYIIVCYGCIWRNICITPWRLSFIALWERPQTDMSAGCASVVWQKNKHFFISVSGISLFCFYCFCGLLYS